MVAREEVTVSQSHDVEKKDVTPTVQIEKPLRQIVSTEELDGLARRDLNGRQV